ncbi:type II secretion system F family protein [Clostridium botulinum]|uniref:Type II secretion system F family protein n=1 Tax=Clostridium botulinum TaxID=1491 RepID=A0A846JFG5_CLOBO|nr:type II secretion system F family protein [Clostridium botulinum]ACA54925.1 general secretion pathway protein [Clostridium botulinum A3 str. Loch Maree]NFH66118.1 type II secretion system F family protein [Clostridium botulinum]NFJ08735.1 type II secretion system F family protein [Clostridium botulinum]NFK15131.1 type II secretion system F family protein [Clostridium botulinum]NFM93091.1 type II secretion system F family protein [Clostridium botulinum]
MDLFYYKAKDIKGNVLKGACNEKEKVNIYKELREKGYFLLNITNKNVFKIRSEKITLKDCSILCNKLYMLMASGINITDAINIAYEDFHNVHVKNSLYTIRNNILRGDSIYNSFKGFSNIYPKFLLSMIYIGEESGRIQYVLSDLKNFYENKYKFNKEIKNALIYPIMVLITFIIMLYILIHMVVPSLIGIFNELGGSIPKKTLGMITAIKVFNVILGILFISIIFILLGSNFFYKRYKIKYAVDNLKIKTPILGQIYKNIFICNFSNSMNLMIKSGIPINKSLKLLEEVTDNYIFKENIKNLNKNIKDGKSISISLNKCGFSNKILLSMVHKI